MGRWQPAAVLSGLALLLAAAGFALADPAGRTWARQPVAGRNIELVGVSCSAKAACTTLGHRGDGGPMAVERWNGRRWSTQPFPTVHTIDSEPGGVSCPSAESCFAVGNYEVVAGRTLPLIERWNGRRWTIQHVRLHTARYGVLSGVSCASPTACVAVGSSYPRSGGPSGLLVERWNGRRWSEQTARVPSGANYGFLDGVSCVSVRTCVAVGAGYVGYQISPLAERWNGRHWFSQKVPGRGLGGLSGVSCSSAGACTAVGNSPPGGRTLAERWDGHRWSIQPTPNPGGTQRNAQNSLSAVSCPAATTCTAVGVAYPPRAGFQAIVEHWNGRRWSTQSTPAVGVASELGGVSCPAVRSCTAVGFYDAHDGSSRPLAEHS
jgi:hypothetical protein